MARFNFSAVIKRAGRCGLSGTLSVGISQFESEASRENYQDNGGREIGRMEWDRREGHVLKSGLDSEKLRRKDSDAETEIGSSSRSEVSD